MMDIELIKLIMTILIAGYIILNFKNILKKLLKFSRGSVILSFIIMIGYLMIALLYFKYDYLMTLLVALLIFMSLLIVFDVLYNSVSNLLEKHTNSNNNAETKNISQINNLIQQDFNVTNINSIGHTVNKNEQINFKKEINLDKVVEELEKRNFISKKDDNVEILQNMTNCKYNESKIDWIDKSPTDKKLNNLRTLIFLLQNMYDFKDYDSTFIYNELFLKYFNLDRELKVKNFSETYSKVSQFYLSNLEGKYKLISEILKLE